MEGGSSIAENIETPPTPPPPSSSSPSSPSSSSRGRRPRAPSFTCFSRLPPEIRHMIWQLTLPGPRTFEVGGPASAASAAAAPCKSARRPRFLAAPTIARVCRESRQVAMFSGRWRLVGKQQQPRPGDGNDYNNYNNNNNGQNPGGGGRGRWTWFDAKTDVLFVHRWFYMCAKSLARSRSIYSYNNSSSSRPASTLDYCRFFDLRDFCRDVRAICLDTRSLVWQPLPVPNIFAFNLMDRGLWPRLETYLFCSDVVCLHLPGKVVRTLALFAGGGRQTALVGAGDLDELRRLKALHDAYGRPRPRHHSSSNSSSYFRGGLPPPLMEQLVRPDLSQDYAEAQLERLRNVWLHAYYSALPDHAPQLGDPTVFQEEPRPNPNLPCFNHEHPWARAALAKMPDYKLVVAFQLCAARHIETKEVYVHDK